MKKSAKYLLALLGLPVVSGCPVMYGCPHADYTIRGVVENEAGEPVKGIEVTCGYARDTTTANGRFVIRNEMPDISETVIARDVDGDENGRYLPKEQPIQLVQTKPGDGDWYEGAYEADVTIILKEDKD